MRLPFSCVAFALLLTVPGLARAQQAPAASAAQTAGGPLIIERVHDGTVVAPEYKVTEVNHETGQLIGGYVGRVIDERLLVGAAAYGLVNGHHGDDLIYGGLLVGWSTPADARIAFGARALTGVGRATLAIDTPIAFGGGGRFPIDGRFGPDPRLAPTLRTIRIRAQDDLFVFEPQATLALKIASHVGLEWAAGYRLVGFDDGLGDRVRGATGSLGLRFGW